MKEIGEIPPKDGPHRATSYDVAQLAKVSQSAVSRCFRPGGSISPEMRKRVLKAAATLGYQPNAMASGLITKRSNLVAILISNLTNLHYPQVLAELTQRFDANGIRVLLFALQAESDVGRALDQVWRYRVDGVIAAARLSPAQLAQFDRHGVPVVLYNRIGESDPVASVHCDSAGGERLLIERLCAKGHKRFAIIAGPSDSFVSNERVESARLALERHGIVPRIVPGNFDHESGGAAATALLSAKTRPDAIVCANDLMAIGALDSARHVFGLNVPAELSIVGFDGVGPAAWPSYQLTTIRQPVRRMTDAAVTMLIDRIENPDLPPEVRSFSGALIEGTSARI